MIFLIEFERSILTIGMLVHCALNFYRRPVRPLRIVPTAPIEVKIVPLGGLTLNERAVVVGFVATTHSHTSRASYIDTPPGCVWPLPMARACSHRERTPWANNRATSGGWLLLGWLNTVDVMRLAPSPHQLHFGTFHLFDTRSSAVGPIRRCTVRNRQSRDLVCPVQIPWP